MFRFVLPFLTIGLLVSAARAQEKFPIKLKRETRGETVQIVETDAETGKMAFTFMGKTQPKEELKGFTGTFKEIIVEKEPGKRATVIRRTYEKAELTRDAKKITPSFLGKEILIERTGKTYKFSVAGKELIGEDLQVMQELFRDKNKEDEDPLEDLLLPKQPVALNEEWKSDVAAIAKELAKEAPMVVDPAKSSCVGKLTKVYKKDGKQFGTLEIEAKLALTKLNGGGMAVDLDAGSQIAIRFQFDGCIDGTLKTGKMGIEMEMKMAGAFKTPDGTEIKMDMNMKKNGTSTQEELKK